MEQFVDLNIITPTPGHETYYYSVCSDLGYRTIAFNTLLDMKTTFIKNQLTLPQPPPLAECPGGLRVLRRVTLICHEPSHLRALKNPALHQFDIVAVRPTTEDLLNQAIQSFPSYFQVVSLDFSTPLPYRLRHSHLHPCKLNSLVFEVNYSVAIKNSSSCRHVVSNTKDLNWVSRGRHFVISSGAEHPMFIRGPYDVINLVSLFGVDFKSAKQAISSNAEQVFLKGFSRSQTYNGIIQKIDISKCQDTSSLPKQLLISETSSSDNSSKRTKVTK